MTHGCETGANEQLAEMVKSGRLDEMRFQQIDDENSDSNSNSGSESEGEQEDAEGESEDGNGYRNHPVTPLKELPKYGKEVFGPYTTVPLDMTIPIPIPNVKAESPLTDLSPTSVGSHVASNPSMSPYDAYLHAKVQHPPSDHLYPAFEPSIRQIILFLPLCRFKHGRTKKEEYLRFINLSQPSLHIRLFHLLIPEARKGIILPFPLQG